MGDVNLSANPAAALAEAFFRLVKKTRNCRVAVSGGSTPRELFRILTSTYRDRIPWERVTLYQVDERCVPFDDPQSNWKMIEEELLDYTSAITSHRMCPEHPRAAENYEALIRQEVRANPQGIPRFDLLLLGMGADGHTASLFPGTRALEERTRLVVLNDVPQLHTQRVTMTFPLINAAKNRWFLVRGPDKAHAFQQAQQGIVPAGRILSPTWFIDPTAAAKPE